MRRRKRHAAALDLDTGLAAILAPGQSGGDDTGRVAAGAHDRTAPPALPDREPPRETSHAAAGHLRSRLRANVPGLA